MKLAVAALAVLALTSCADVRINRADNMLKANFIVKNADNVSLCASFNGYEEIKGTRDKSRFSFLLPDTKGFKYFLKVDGRIYLPNCKMKENDDFGGQLCIFEEE